MQSNRLAYLESPPSVLELNGYRLIQSALSPAMRFLLSAEDLSGRSL